MSRQDSEADENFTPELRDNIEVEFKSLRRRIAELEENVDGWFWRPSLESTNDQHVLLTGIICVVGKDGAIMSLSEENARLLSELQSVQQNGVHTSNHNNDDTSVNLHELETRIRELTAHVSSQLS